MMKPKRQISPNKSSKSDAFTRGAGFFTVGTALATHYIKQYDPLYISMLFSAVAMLSPFDISYNNPIVHKLGKTFGAAAVGVTIGLSQYSYYDEPPKQHDVQNSVPKLYNEIPTGTTPPSPRRSLQR